MSVITSTKNDFIKTARSLKTKKGRINCGCFLVEGDKCVEELIKSSPELVKYVITIEETHKSITDAASSMGLQTFSVKEKVLDSVTDFKTSQGIAVVVSFPGYKPVYSGFILALDDVSDPQNVGTMIRTADAAGCSGVVLSKSSADYLSPKAVRASMGSIFHIPVFYCELIEYLNKLSGKGYRIAAADMYGEPNYGFDEKKTCLVIGNESRGVSENILKICTDKISVPMYGKAESLNAAVAAGILIYKIVS